MPLVKGAPHMIQYKSFNSCDRRGFSYVVGRTMFETNGLPPSLLDPIKEADEIWVPTEFNRQTFAASGINPENVYVLPEVILTFEGSLEGSR